MISGKLVIELHTVTRIEESECYEIGVAVHDHIVMDVTFAYITFCYASYRPADHDDLDREQVMLVLEEPLQQNDIICFTFCSISL